MTEAYPLQWPAGWPRTPTEKQDRGWQFKQRGVMVTFAVSRDKLYEELKRLGAKNPVVSSNHAPDKFGIPVESKRRTGDDGIAVYFQLNGRPMAMACDRYDNAAANMRSLGLAIEAMRQLERHGGGTMMERAFSGFAALPAPKEKWSWWIVLECMPDSPMHEIDANYKRLARQYHPDNGGTADKMAELNQAISDARWERMR